jgi:cytochrome P450
LTAAVATFGTNPSAAELASLLESLPYLNAVCNETLRFFPPVPIIRRTCNTPTAILGVPISPGTRIILSPWATNRNPALWGADANVFKPERWINQDTGKANKHGGMQSNYANLTFSHGPRSCTGQNFAKAELRSLVAVWCSRFGFERATVETIVPVGIVSVRSRDGLDLRIWERDWERMANPES